MRSYSEMNPKMVARHTGQIGNPARSLMASFFAPQIILLANHGMKVSGGGGLQHNGKNETALLDRLKKAIITPVRLPMLN